MAAPLFRFEVPIRDLVLQPSGYLNRPWEAFFRFVQQRLDSLGSEKFFQLTNNQVAAANVEGLAFNADGTSQAVVDFLIQRVTTSTGATELITSGTFHAVYKPTSLNWAIVTMGTPGPSTSGITFSITATGQVQYTSTNITGTASISKLTYRARTLSGKNSLYSQVGK